MLQKLRVYVILVVLTVVASTVAASAMAVEPTFRSITIDADSTYCACAVLDVNSDGMLDIVSGGFWYEAQEVGATVSSQTSKKSVVASMTIPIW